MQNQNSLQRYEQEQQMIQLENARAIQDTNWVAPIALPAANSTTVDTASFNLLEAYVMSESFNVEVDVDPMSTLGAGNTLSVALQMAPDNATWVAIPGLAAQVITGNTAVETLLTWKLPPGCNQYIRATFTTGGAITSSLAGENGTLYLKF
jgi:hypothetical protein